MFGRKKVDVLVVGAGPVGLFAALALAKQGVQVMIADREWRTGAHSYALALHPRSLALLGELGIQSEVLAKALPLEKVGLYDGRDQRAEVALASEQSDNLPLAVMRQDVLERTLEEALRKAGVEVLWNHAASRLVPEDDHVLVHLDKLEKDSVGYGVSHTEWMIAKSFEAKAGMVIGADGHHSLARRTLEVEFPELSPPEHYAVFECELKNAMPPEMMLNLRDETTDVVWPLPDRRCRWSFQLLNYEGSQRSRAKSRVPVEIGGQRFPLLSEEQLQQLLTERAPWFEGEIENVEWRIVVRFEHRLASSFGRGRIWLAGDAGHLTGPAGMQSMNVGLQEAKTLADLMAEQTRGADVSEKFAEYDRQRRRQWRFLQGSDGEVRSDRADEWLTRVGDRLRAAFPGSGPELQSMLNQLQLETA